MLVKATVITIKNTPQGMLYTLSHDSADIPNPIVVTAQRGLTVGKSYFMRVHLNPDYYPKAVIVRQGI